MTTMTLSVNDGLKAEMDLFPQINWSAVAREAFARQLAQLKLLKELTRDSDMTEADAVVLGRRLKKEAMKRHPEWFR